VDGAVGVFAPLLATLYGYEQVLPMGADVAGVAGALICESSQSWASRHARHLENAYRALPYNAFLSLCIWDEAEEAAGEMDWSKVEREIGAAGFILIEVRNGPGLLACSELLDQPFCAETPPWDERIILVRKASRRRPLAEFGRLASVGAAMQPWLSEDQDSALSTSAFARENA
jgi:hypothetical protein